MKRDRSHASNVTPIPDVYLRPLTIPDEPRDLEAFHEFIMKEFEDADVEVKHSEINKVAWGTSAGFSYFRKEKSTIALGGLYGCTSLVVVSHKGAWVSHIWERALLNFRGEELTGYWDPVNHRYINHYEREGTEGRAWGEFKQKVSRPLKRHI